MTNYQYVLLAVIVFAIMIVMVNTLLDALKDFFNAPALNTASITIIVGVILLMLSFITKTNL